MKQAVIALISCLLSLRIQGQVSQAGSQKLNYETAKTELLQILKDDQEPKVAYYATQDQYKKDSIKRIGVELEKMSLLKVKSILKQYGWLGQIR